MIVIAAALAATGCKPSPHVNKLPPRAERAFADLTGARLISLEPDPEAGAQRATLYGFIVLGSMPLKPAEAAAAVAAFKTAIARSDGTSAACFNPHHALRTHVQGHTYEALICYDCGSVEVFEDGRIVGGAAVAGSPVELDRILIAGHVPISHSQADEQARARMAEAAAAQERWDAAAPASVRAVGLAWTPDEEPDPDRLFRALTRQMPHKQSQILALLRWYGSGVGSWSDYPDYERMAAKLLRRYSTADIVEVVSSRPLTEAEAEGAARFFGDYESPAPRRVALPPAVRRRLLAQGLKSKDGVRRALARDAFSQRAAAK